MTKAGECPVGPHVRLLEGVVHELPVAAQQLVGQPAQPLVVAAHDVSEGGRVAAEDFSDDIHVGFMLGDGQTQLTVTDTSRPR